MLQTQTVARSEFAEWDPFAHQPGALSSPTVDDEPDDEPVTDHRPKSLSKWPQKYKRSPLRDVSSKLRMYIAGLAQQSAVHNVPANKWTLDAGAEVRLANEFNLKPQHIHECWCSDDDDEVTPADLAARGGACAAELGAHRRLAPLRHLIALATKPHEAEDGEIDRAAEGLGAVVPADLHRTITDLALMLDLTAKVKELRASVVKELYAHYERRVDAEPTIKTLVVNWHRDHRPTFAIYPPGVSRWIDSDEAAS